MENQDYIHRRSRNRRRILIELLQSIDPLLEPQKNFPSELNRLFRENRRFGSRDRRLYRELIYTYLRFLPWIRKLGDDDEKRVDAILQLASQSADIAAMREDSMDFQADDPLESLVPSWFAAHLVSEWTAEDYRTLLSRPPLWIRAQCGSPTSVAEQLTRELSLEPHAVVASQVMPHAISCPPDSPVHTAPSYQSGQFEIQDISSQSLLELVHPAPKGRWLDACAGAGGKTLQLAALLGSQGSVTAYDPRSSALAELAKRARRAQLSNIEIETRKPEQVLFDGILVDAPCSGSGTWRRHPYLMRQTTEASIFEATQLQAELLDIYAPLVAIGGTLVYSTCSLSRHENEGIVSNFLDSHSEFAWQPLASRFGLSDSGNGITVTPRIFDGDGLFVASFKRQ